MKLREPFFLDYLQLRMWQIEDALESKYSPKTLAYESKLREHYWLRVVMTRSDSIYK